MTIYEGQPHHAWRKNGKAFSIGTRRGATQLALALLYDVTRDKTLAVRHYQKFKEEVVVKLPMDKPWRLTSDDIEAWLLLEKIAGEK